MTIHTNDCKKAIVTWIKANPGHVARQFYQPGDVKSFEHDATLEKNWKRETKEKDGNLTVREFDCRPYDDQLRATVWDDGNKIVRLVISGE
jgi:hypothetical protein